MKAATIVGRKVVGAHARIVSPSGAPDIFPAGYAVRATNPPRHAYQSASFSKVTRGRGFALGRVAGGLSLHAKELRVHASSLFRSSREVTAKACEEKNHIRKPSERSLSWTA